MGDILVSPAEPRVARDEFTSSSIPERYGADFFWACPYGFVVVQRKTYEDLVASMHDGRIGKEVAQSQPAAFRILTLEGRPTWTVQGELAGVHHDVTKEQIQKFLLTVRLKGMWVVHTDDLPDTLKTVRWLHQWTHKKNHRSLDSRPSPTVGAWGKRSSRDWQRHVLTSFDGIGPTTADNIIDHFGTVPLSWDVTKEQLMEVDGVGPVTVKRLMEALDDT